MTHTRHLRKSAGQTESPRKELRDTAACRTRSSAGEAPAAGTTDQPGRPSGLPLCFSQEQRCLRGGAAGADEATSAGRTLRHRQQQKSGLEQQNRWQTERSCRELEVCNSVAGGINSGSAGQSSGKRIRAAEVAGKGATSRAVESSQRDLGSATASPTTAAAELTAGAAVDEPNGAGTSRTGADAVAADKLPQQLGGRSRLPT